MTQYKTTPETDKNIHLQYQQSPKAGFLRRMGAYFYDVFMVAALLMLATVLAIIIVAVSNQLGLVNLSTHTDIADYLANSAVFAAYLALVIITFYGYFWCHGGQTLGMKAWRLRLQKRDGSNITFTQALIRMATSAFGLGNIAALFKNSMAFQDLWAECEMVVLTKELNRDKER